MEWWIGVNRPVHETDRPYFYPAGKEKRKKKRKKKKYFFTFFPCDACLRRWISPLVPTALFSIIFFQTSNQKSVLKNKLLSSFKKKNEKKKKSLPTYIPIFFNFYVTPIKPFLIFRLNVSHSSRLLTLFVSTSVVIVRKAILMEYLTLGCL